MHTDRDVDQRYYSSTAGRFMTPDPYTNSGTASANMDVAYTYNNEGKMTAVTYPTTYPGGVNTPGASYNYAYDGMMQLNGMTDSSSNSVVSSVAYGASSELLDMTYRPNVSTPSITETRTYNNLGQLTNLVNTNYSGTIMNLAYGYPTGSNNGKINSQADYVSGEQVAYTYDSLNRLISAVTTPASDQVTTAWGQGFSYDGFGNLTGKTVLKGSVPTYSVYVDQANHVSTTTYDPNGNAYPYAGSVYDAENRLTYLGNGSSTSYGYDAQNKRIYTSGTYDSYSNPTGYTVMLYSPGGQKLGTYQIAVGTSLATTLVSSDMYFGSRRISAMDRLGSVGKFYPYGEGKGGTNPADTWSFATYWRDSATNLDYADQRYYSSAGGRFMTPDPYQASGGPAQPQSWNRYAYVGGDPINRTDRTGLRWDWADPGDDWVDGGYYDDISIGGGAHSITLDWEATARSNCDDGQWQTSFTGFAPCLQAGFALLAAQAANPPPTCQDSISGSGTYYTCIRQFGADWNQLVSDLGSIEKKLAKDQTCDNLLTSGGTSLNTIDNILSNPYTFDTLAKAILTRTNQSFWG